jgi:hypothetical protein
VRSRTTARFRKCFSNLPKNIQEQARAAYRHFLKDPSHPSLRFKPVHPTVPVYSVRVGKAYRALGRRDDAGVIWFWIGSHADYDKLLTQF